MSELDFEHLARMSLAAYESKDIDFFAQNFHEDVLLRDWNLEVRGRDAALKEFEKNFAAAVSLHIHIISLLKSETQVAAEVEIVVNQTDRLRVVDIFTFDSTGLVTRLVSYKGL